MKKKIIGKLTSFLFVMVMCVSLCIDFTANATDGGTSQQVEQTGHVKQEKKTENILTEENGRRLEETEEWQENIKAQELSEKFHETTKLTEPMSLSAPNLSNPRIETDSSMTAGQKVTWDCVWFGRYPQAEVVPSADDYTAVDKSMLRSGDIIEDGNLYSKLQSASGWDVNNDVIVDGHIYRRIKEDDVTSAISGVSAYYNWSNSNLYHYFKYEPIKWRVLKVNNNRAFLLSDIIVDNQVYNPVYEDITWETSTIRSWLNGYGTTFNKQEKDFGSKNFIDNAFSTTERLAIENTNVINDNNITYESEGGNNTTDKIFLLSESETYGDSAIPYGFEISGDVYDEARRSRSSTYAKAMGICSYTDDAYKGSGFWWLRSPGHMSVYAAYVQSRGHVRCIGEFVNYDRHGVRVALNLNLSSNLHTYAGTVSSNGEEVIPVTEIKLSNNKYQMKAGDREQITVFVLPENATDKSVDWSSSDNSIAEIDSDGIVTAKASGKCTIQCTAVSNSAINQSAEIEVFTDKTEGSDSGNNPAGSTGVAKKNQSINTSAPSYTKAIGSKSFSLGANASGGGKLTYTSSNKKVATVSSAGQVSVKSYGTAMITISASATQNCNVATKKVSIKVVPKKASLKSAKSPSKKKMKISWKKDKKVTGYEIYVSPKKDFSRETIKRNYKKNTVSKTISGWKSKRTYYVKIRGYKKIGKAKYYGAWSSVKKVKVK